MRVFCHRAPYLTTVLAVAGVACGGTASRVVLGESFEHAQETARTWSSVLPEIAGASVSFADGAAQLTLPSAGEIHVRRWLDVGSLRGQRLHISARARTDAPESTLYLAVAIGESSPTFLPRTRVNAKPSDTWTVLDTTLDVGSDRARAELDLVFQGKGHAWFDDVQVEVLGPTPHDAAGALSAQQIENVVALTRAATLIRFRHPSDEIAALDWDRFLAFAIDRVLAVRDRAGLQQALADLFAPIAPTIEFTPTATAGREPPRGHGDHLARWWHYGASNQNIYHVWREGRDPEPISIYATVPLALPDRAHCTKPRVIAHVASHAGPDAALVFARVGQAGYPTKWFDHKIEASETAPAIDLDLPADAVDLHVGVELDGRAAIDVEGFTLRCDDRDVAQLRAGEAAWTFDGEAALYRRAVTPCGDTQCLSVQRLPAATAFDPTHDLLHAQVAPGVWMHLPLAVWADDHRTFPAATAWQSAAQPSDRSRRLSVIASAWGILWLFYPDFQDQQIDWPAALPGSLAEAAAARSLADTHRALAMLLVKLHDDHAQGKHPAFPTDGLLPVAVRRFGDRVIVTGAVDDYRAELPVGSEVLAIGGVPALQAFTAMRDRTSAATSAWAEAVVPFWLDLGPRGTFSTWRIERDGRAREVVLPHLPRAVADARVREPRPEVGAELAPGVVYIDLESLQGARWRAALPAMERARAIILDMRGAASNAALSALGHFIDHPIRSPIWHVPILESGQSEDSSWEIRPAAPRLTAKVIMLIDGRAVSVSETEVQLAHDHHLATLVGEPTAGTNGNIQLLPLPEGFSMRFTGMRVLHDDGTPLQGHGFAPDVVVHPTLAGVRAGRDEILEAALALVKP